MTRIVGDEERRSGAPRIEGTRITVLDIKRRVVDGEEDPFAVAAEYDLEAGAVFTALAYYYEHPDEMAELEAERGDRLGALREESAALRDRLEEEQSPKEA